MGRPDPERALSAAQRSLQEIEQGRRFPFGRNWQNFLAVLDDPRIAVAEGSLKEALGVVDLRGKRFLDAGCGSGLFSLAAARLGADRIHSFDYDPQSVACTQELRSRHVRAHGAADWVVEQGSVLDEPYLSALGPWDVVYSWGVLHHTGALWRALANVAGLVKPGGALVVSIYNDQGSASRRWRLVKRIYNRSRPAQYLIRTIFIGYWLLAGFAVDLLKRQNPVLRYRRYYEHRGMSVRHDWLDWLGGYPFEVSRPEAVFDFCRRRGFVLERLRTSGGSGCNEFVFRKQ